MFANRQDAGRRLAAALMRFKNQSPCVLALPRGGVPVAFEIAQALDAPLDIVFVRKIGAPGQPEFAIGAIVDGPKPELVLNEEAALAWPLPEGYLARATQEALQEIERRRRIYLGEKPPLDVTGRLALLVDDGIATGSTVRAAIRAISGTRPKRLVLAVPVAPAESVRRLRGLVDDLICLETPDYFRAVGLHYLEFEQVRDADVRDLLARAAAGRPPSGAASRHP